MKPEETAATLLALSDGVRYVAVRHGDEVSMRQRADLRNASSGESDLYEELLVNPTLLKLAGERGRIDCGGLEFLVVRYGSFFQLVLPTKSGHVSIAIEPEGDPTTLAARARQVLGL
jgi:hypothetical protein